MPDFGIFRGFSSKAFSDKLFAGQTPSNLGSMDSDVLGFFNRVNSSGGILSDLEKNAIIQLVYNLKLYGIWTKMKAIYPMIGSSASACSQNLKSSNFTGTFSSGWTILSTGITPNGTSSFFDTKLNASTQLNLNNVHMSYYSRTNNSSSTVYHTDMGCSDSPTDSESGNYLGLYLRRLVSSNLSAFECNTYTSGIQASFTNSNSACMVIGSRISSSLNKIYRNGILQNSAININISNNPNYNIYIGANNKLNNASNFGILQCAFASIGDGLTDIEASNLYTSVQVFQTTLGRQI